MIRDIIAPVMTSPDAFRNSRLSIDLAPELEETHKIDTANGSAAQAYCPTSTLSKRPFLAQSPGRIPLYEKDSSISNELQNALTVLYPVNDGPLVGPFERRRFLWQKNSQERAFTQKPQRQRHTRVLPPRKRLHQVLHQSRSQSSRIDSGPSADTSTDIMKRTGFGQSKNSSEKRPDRSLRPAADVREFMVAGYPCDE
jgi:hypothetical protein